jgi:DNA-binding response OmpR family regulator
MATVRRILIVDDDTELREALVEQLSLHEGFEAISVDTGAKGVQAAKGGQIDLVIMDVGLPDIDGREAVRLLRKNSFKAPIIMLTGHDTDSDTMLGLEAGANDYVVKPFRFPVLLARIRAQLRQHETSADAVFTMTHRKGDRHPAVPLPGRRKNDLPRSSAARGLGIQFRRDDAHTGDTYLSAAPEN